MTVLPRERRWGLGLSAAVHALALTLLLAQSARGPDLPPAAVRPFILSLEPPIPAAAPVPPHPKPAVRATPSEVKPGQPGRAPLEPLARGSAPPAFDAPPAPIVWTPALPDGLGSGIGPGAAVGEGEGAGDEGGDGNGGGGDGSLAGVEPELLEGPRWIRRPSHREMRSVLPPGARASGLTGRVLLACLVSPDNRAHGCEVIREKPAGHGFGLAAQQLSLTFLIRPPLRNGQPRYDVPVHIPILWNRIRPWMKQ